MENNNNIILTTNDPMDQTVETTSQETEQALTETTSETVEQPTSEVANVSTEESPASETANDSTKESTASNDSAEDKTESETVLYHGLPQVSSTFEELGVSGEILRAITEMGYENPMPVQEKVIPYLLGHNNDVVALAQTGTGKTAAYGLPVLQKINTSSTDVQAIIMAPTRELCLQITDDLKDYSKYINGLHVLADRKSVV